MAVELLATGARGRGGGSVGFISPMPFVPMIYGAELALTAVGLVPLNPPFSEELFDVVHDDELEEEEEDVEL